MKKNSKEISVNFFGFGQNFDPKNNWLLSILKKRYTVHITDDPSYIFIGSIDSPKYHHLTSKRISIFIPGEAIFPDFNIYDYAIGFDNFHINDRYFRYLFLADSMQRGKEVLAPLPIDKRKFCNFIYANPDAHPDRDIFFHKLSSYKNIDSLGLHLKNTTESIEPRGGNWYQGSIDAKSKYKFSIAFENALHPGYTSEKIFSSFQANTVPIYWGNPDISREVNPDSFINCHDFNCFDEVIEHIKKIDGNNELYLQILNSPKGDLYSKHFYQTQRQKLESFLFHIFDQDFKQGQRRPYGYWNDRYINTLKFNSSYSSKANLFIRKVLHKLNFLAGK